MSLCLAAAGVAVEIAVSTFTLSWTHSVEKTLWEEEWRIAGDRLAIVKARVEASGAGMEPPAEAQLVRGFYVWQPMRAPLAELVLRRAAQAGDWHLCAGTRCAALGAWLGRDADPVRLSAVHGSGGCEPGESR
jgi:hypothetical protein